ncbi:hypothetical protein [Synechococcus sp. PCC 7335]|uniref:hypothetical protein n=1 Tax=Synechococcus sp. (strain ATCC 29403 / PCC 7335) TaxID=91464 RepID=UPI0002E19091|nr:hypothetical protein [Synechococcus sp. PCC 7335]
METPALYLVVNKAIGRFPGFLFLPIPLLCVLLVAFTISIALTLFLELGMGGSMLLGIFLTLTWLFVVGLDPIRFTYSLIPPPRWVRGRYTAVSVLESE